MRRKELNKPKWLIVKKELSDMLNNEIILNTHIFGQIS